MSITIKKPLLFLLIGLFSLCLSLHPTKVWGTNRKATTTQVKQVIQTHKKPWWSNLTASVNLGTSLGTGSFAPSETYKNDYIAQSLSISLNYKVWKGLYLGGRWGFNIEYTQPDNASGRRFFSQDLTLSSRWQNPIAGLTPLMIHSLRLNLQFPTSVLAQTQTRILRINMGFSLLKTIKRLITIGYSFGVTKNFHRYTSPIFNQRTAQMPSILMRQSTRQQGELNDGFAPIPATKNISWQLSNSLFVGVNFHKTLSLQITFAVLNGFKYATQQDQYTPTIPTASGNQKADRIGRYDLTMGDIALAWRPHPYLRIALGALSYQSPFTANGGLRVPFFNLATPNDNTTTFYINLTGQFYSRSSKIITRTNN